MEFVKLLPIQYTPSTHLSFLFSESKLCALNQKVNRYWENVNLSTDAVLTKLLLTFFDVERNHSNVWKEMQTPGGVYG